NVNKYLSKGSLAGVDGRLQTRNYENKEGQRVYVTEVIADILKFYNRKTQMTLNKIYINNKYNKHVDNRNIQITNQ
ncbi:single-stranded DNA-binding protein, partial [Staphylococcus aureus M0637]